MSATKLQTCELTCIICKVFEGFVRDKLYDHFVKNNLLSSEQFGFCKGRSCITQLLCTVNDWLSCFDENVPVDAAYLDFCKAFDSVLHERLLTKIYGYGVRGKVFDWIRNFLTDRSQFVKINNSSSENKTNKNKIHVYFILLHRSLSG